MSLPIEILKNIYIESDIDTRFNLNKVFSLDVVYKKRPQLNKVFLKDFERKMNKCLVKSLGIIKELTDQHLHFKNNKYIDQPLSDFYTRVYPRNIWYREYFF